MNTHRTHLWIDDRSLALATATAAKLCVHPELVDVARSNLLRWKQTISPWPQALAEWEQILSADVRSITARLTEDTADGRRLRQSSPFAGVLTTQERRAIFEQYESVPA